MRVLLTAAGGTGHLNPLLPLADGFARLGAEIRVVGPPALAELVAATGYRFHARPAIPDADLEPLRARTAELPPDQANLILNRDLFGRLATDATLPVLRALCRDWRPDLVLRDPCEYAAAIIATEQAIPHAQVAISFAEVEFRVVGEVASVLPARVITALRTAPYLTRFPAELDPSPFPNTVRFREPPEPVTPLPDWWPGDARPLVYLTLGTVTAERRDADAAYRTALAAMAGLDARVLLTTGGHPELGPIPSNVHVEPFVPQRDVLAAATVVACHGGSGTTFGALGAGVPLVLLPRFADQPANAHRVAEAGAGIAVDPTDAAAIRTAVGKVLTDMSYRAAAGRIADQLRTQPELDAVVAQLVQG